MQKCLSFPVTLCKTMITTIKKTEETTNYELCTHLTCPSNVIHT